MKISERSQRDRQTGRSKTFKQRHGKKNTQKKQTNNGKHVTTEKIKDQRAKNSRTPTMGIQYSKEIPRSKASFGFPLSKRGELVH